jgi:hypothetical protein
MPWRLTKKLQAYRKSLRYANFYKKSRGGNSTPENFVRLRPDLGFAQEIDGALPHTKGEAGIHGGEVQIHMVTVDAAAAVSNALRCKAFQPLPDIIELIGALISYPRGGSW